MKSKLSFINLSLLLTKCCQMFIHNTNSVSFVSRIYFKFYWYYLQFFLSNQNDNFKGYNYAGNTI